MRLWVDWNQSLFAFVPETFDQDACFTVENRGVGVDSSLVEPLESYASVLAPDKELVTRAR